MTSRQFICRTARVLAFFGAVGIMTSTPAWSGERNAPQTSAATLSFAGVDYLHRWSRAGQHEFTPRSDADLERWQDMVTINVHDAVRNGDQLANAANQVLGKYQSRGNIMRTDSRPRTPQRPAEHLIVAVLGSPGFLEAAFARFALVDGIGVVTVYSHRIYGTAVGDAMSAWLNANGAAMEQKLIAWDRMPSVSALRQLPQSR